MLPCKTGDVVYELDRFARGDKIIKHSINRIIFETAEISFEEQDIKEKEWVFLTQEEAEKVLKREKEY